MELINEGVNDYKSQYLRKFTDSQINELIEIGGGIPWKRGEHVKYVGKSLSEYTASDLMHGELHTRKGEGEGKSKLFFGGHAYHKDFTYFGINYDLARKYGHIFIDVEFYDIVYAVKENSTGFGYYDRILQNHDQIPKGAVCQMPLFYVENHSDELKVVYTHDLKRYGTKEEVNSKFAVLPILLEKMNKTNGIEVVDLKNYIEKKDSNKSINVIMYPILLGKYEKSDRFIYSKEKAKEISKTILELGASFIKPSNNKEYSIEDIDDSKRQVEHSLNDIYDLAKECGIDFSKLSNDHRGLISIDELGLF